MLYYPVTCYKGRVRRHRRHRQPWRQGEHLLPGGLLLPDDVRQGGLGNKQQNNDIVIMILFNNKTDNNNSRRLSATYFASSPASPRPSRTPPPPTASAAPSASERAAPRHVVRCVVSATREPCSCDPDTKRKKETTHK